MDITAKSADHPTRLGRSITVGQVMLSCALTE